MNLLSFILIPILLSIIIYLFYHELLKLLMIGIQFLLTVYAVYLLTIIKTGGEIINSLGGYSSDYAINLVADNISILLVSTSCFIFTMTLIYNYHKRHMNKLFLMLFICLEGLINGIFLVDDFFSLYVLIEVSTVCVAILIMFNRSKQSIYDGLVYLLVNIVAMTFFLLAIAFIYKIFGTLNLQVLRENISLATPRSLILPYALLITAVGLKSAIMPLFSWLPKAHGTPSAPSAVSAILSGLYVKGGIYLLIRINTIFLQVIDVGDIFVVIGFLTAVIGFIFALSQTDIKLILVYHTVSQIGLIIFGLSLHSDYSYYGAIYHIMNHAIFKTTLFLTAGIIYSSYQTRDIRKIRGVFKRMPIVGIVTLIAILGITGAPLFNGSISKYLISKGTYSSFMYEGAMFIINLGTILSFVKYSTILFGKSEKVKVDLLETIAISILAIITFIGGVFGQYFVNYIFDLHITLAVSDIFDKLLVYIFSLIIGIVFYRFCYPKISYFKRIQEIELSFNGIILSMVVFFVAFTSYCAIIT